MGENPIETRYMQLADDRKLAYCEYGDPDGKPVFYFHGTPGSRYEPELGDSAAKKHGYRVIALDRPGIGHSDYIRGRKLLDWPVEVGEAATLLGLEQFGVMGVSGGGAFALACSYAIPERLLFTVIMGSWAPVAEEPALWDEMAPLDRFFGKLSKQVPWAFYAPFSMIGFAAKKLSPQNFIRSLDSSMSEADSVLMENDDLARFFAEDVKEAFRQGVRGPADDAIILYRDWGFRIEDIGVEVTLFHGQEDRFAPYNFALYLDDKITRSILHTFPGEGHLFLIQIFDKVFEQISGI